MEEKIIITLSKSEVEESVSDFLNKIGYKTKSFEFKLDFAVRDVSHLVVEVESGRNEQ